MENITQENLLIINQSKENQIPNCIEDINRPPCLKYNDQINNNEYENSHSPISIINQQAYEQINKMNNILGKYKNKKIDPKTREYEKFITKKFCKKYECYNKREVKYMMYLSQEEYLRYKIKTETTREYDDVIFNRVVDDDSIEVVFHIYEGRKVLGCWPGTKSSEAECGCFNELRK